MPIYEYRCTRCGRDFELVRTHQRADEPAACAECGAPSTRRISAIARCRGGEERTSAGSSGGRCGSCSGGNCAGCR